MSNSIAPAAEFISTAAETALTVEGITATEVINATEAPVIAGETTVLAAEVVTDAELIAAAKVLNDSAQSFLRKGVEEFWKLGKALTRLQDRPSVKGRWREVLREIGLNPTSANHAQRLHAATTLEKLAGYRNKTAALRALGILTEASLAKKKETSDQSSKATAKAAPSKPIVSEAAPVGPALTKIPADQPTEAPPADFASNNVDITAGGKVEEIMTGSEAKSDATGDTAEGRLPEPAPAEMTLDPLTKITRLAASLEYLAADEIDFTAEFIAQVERAKTALDLLLGKGAFHAAA